MHGGGYCGNAWEKLSGKEEKRHRMKRLFKAINQNNFEEVKDIIESYYDDPELVNCIAKAPPKKDEGQSALQVAIKNGGGWKDTRIISYLLDKGADVNFIEDDKGLGPWEICCCPVLMDMGEAVYASATELDFKYKPEETKSRVNEFIAVFQHMLELGADPNKTDNKLQPVWMLVLHDGYECHHTGNHKVSNEEYNAFLADITKRLMNMMIAHGANIYREYIAYPKDDPRYTNEYSCTLRSQIVINNLVFNRELTYGLPEEAWYLAERKWIDLMKPYYKKDNPYYGAEVSEERKQFFRQLEQLRDEEEKDII